MNRLSGVFPSGVVVRFVPVFSLARLTATPTLAQSRLRRGRPRHWLLSVAGDRATAAAFTLRRNGRGRVVLETGAEGQPALERIAFRDIDAGGLASPSQENVLREMAERLGVRVPDGGRVARVAVAADGSAEVTFDGGGSVAVRQPVPGRVAEPVDAV